MAHSLILGMTESGKTTLAKRLAEKYRAQGFSILVLDPMNDPGWPADYRTSDPDEFLRVFWNSRKCMVFIDESGDAIGRYNKPMERTATRGRHWGHSCHYLTQRGAQISQTVRDQCSHLFLFASSLKDRKLHAEEWNAPKLVEPLNQGEFFHCTRFSAPKKGKVF